MLEFISNNSIWFIAGGVLLILVIIGYYADKKGFGAKKVEKEEVKEEVPEEVFKVEKKEKKKKEVVTEDMDIPFVADVEPETKEEVVEAKEEDLNVPFGDSETASLDEYASSGSNDTTSSLDEYASGEDLNAPFGDQEVKEEIIEEPKEEVVEPIEEIEPEVKEEKVETIDDKEESQDEDIWNF